LAIKIFLDQGHNPMGVNAGAEAFGIREQDITYIVGIYLKNLLEADPRFEVRVSRPTPETSLGTNNTTSLAERVRMANSWPADYFLSIHANANPNPAINGAEAYVYETNTQSYYLGQHIVDSISKRLNVKDNLVRINKSLFVLRRTNMPSVLIELGYLTNYEEAMKLNSRQWEYANAIYLGLLSYFGLEPV
jgi:N-acetylmuramoyl-L-alanine amidase